MVNVPLAPGQALVLAKDASYRLVHGTAELRGLALSKGRLVNVYDYETVFTWEGATFDVHGSYATTYLFPSYVHARCMAEQRGNVIVAGSGAGKRDAAITLHNYRMGLGHPSVLLDLDYRDGGLTPPLCVAFTCKEAQCMVEDEWRNFAFTGADLSEGEWKELAGGMLAATRCSDSRLVVQLPANLKPSVLADFASQVHLRTGQTSDTLVAFGQDRVENTFLQHELVRSGSVPFCVDHFPKLSCAADRFLWRSYLRNSAEVKLPARDVRVLHPMRVHGDMLSLNQGSKMLWVDADKEQAWEGVLPGCVVSVCSEGKFLMLGALLCKVEGKLHLRVPEEHGGTFAKLRDMELKITHVDSELG